MLPIVDPHNRPGESDQRWQAIGRASAIVVMASEREAGLWSYPTTANEVGANYSIRDSEEFKARSIETFGSESLTATCVALIALAELLDSCPRPIFTRASQAFETHRDGAEPVYGTAVTGRRQPGINKSARHTAMAVLTKILPVSRGLPPPPYRPVEEIVSWLLSARRPDGGWPYEESDRSRDDPISTAACLAAICWFLARFRSDIPRGVSDKIRSSVADGFESLRKQQTGPGLWRGYIPGQTDVIDSAFVIDLLSMHVVRTELEKMMPSTTAHVDNFKLALRDCLLDGGWPDTWEPLLGSPRPSLGATISSLLVLNGFRDGRDDARWQTSYRNTQDRVVTELFEYGGAASLTSWDWIMLCRLAARHHKLVGEDGRLFESAERLQRTASTGGIREGAMRDIPDIAHHTLRFVMSRGKSGEMARQDSTERSPKQVEGAGSAVDLLNDEEMSDRIRSRNAETFRSLVRQLRSPLGIIPFIGAGMSASVTLAEPPLKFPQWSDLLVRLATGRGIEAKVKALLEAGDYEQAASVVEMDRSGILPQSIRDAFDREVPKEHLITGALSYVPFLAKGPVITTNYDHVLEQCFKAWGREFEAVISGPLPDATVSAVHHNENALLKIHGDCRDRTFRVFTVEEYRRAYGGMVDEPGDSERADIGSLAWLLFANRPLLFLGCSLEQDRTVHVLRSIKRQLAGLTHFAVTEANHSPALWERRERHLDGLGVRALWFAPGRYADIEVMLRDVLEAASTRPLVVTGSGSLPPASTGAPRVTMAEVEALLPKSFTHGDLERHSSDLGVISQDLYAGKLAFFLGAYASLGQSILGDAFYSQLAEKFGCPALAGDRTAVASYVMSHHGRGRLWQEVRSVFEANTAGPSAVHRLIAALPAHLRGKGKASALWVLTTNYDRLMERAMIEAGEAFRLIYYANDYTNGEGRFIERSPEGSLRCIENPQNLRHVSATDHVIVKLNGGLTYYPGIPEQVSIDRADFERLAARIPDILPAFLRTELRARSLLFLGHGLAEPDVRAVIRFGSREDKTLWSWAVKLAPEDPKWRHAWDADVEHLRSLGLRILNDDLARFTAALYRHLIGGSQERRERELRTTLWRRRVAAKMKTTKGRDGKNLR
jgi:hypothetical protein